VIHAWLPQGVAPHHAMVADQDILDRAVERVAHVQAAGHVGRRHHDGIGPGRRSQVGSEGVGGLPLGVVLGLDLGGSKSLVQHRWPVLLLMRAPCGRATIGFPARA
jgi:hypothetical protein